ncbi:MAG: V-type ATP synthase subunit A [Deltaproteobacteria bacterium]|nr:MAG: V-type ATP synthase subunit A [Deltaproteobacteria bacterium]
MSGQVISISGATVRIDLPGLKVGDRVLVGVQRLPGEVVRLHGAQAIVQVFEENRGLGVGEPVRDGGGPLKVVLGPGLLGQVFDGLQRPLPELRRLDGAFMRRGSDPFPLDLARRWTFRPGLAAGAAVAPGDLLGTVREGHLDHPIFARESGEVAWLAAGELPLAAPVARLAGGGELPLWQAWPVRRPRPSRGKQVPARPLVTGQRALDLLFPLFKGGVAIIPGGFGTGKTVLEQSIAKYADVDVVVYVGCGERGNEMAGLLDEFASLEDPRSGRPLMERTIVVANTSNMPVAARESSIFTAVSMAEYYRDLGLDVLFLADSLSRWAEALREISAALEEMPGEDGYPTYLGSKLAAFIERAGVVETAAGGTGSLSMILAVSPPGADFSEPVTQACLRVAGAFYQLDTRLAHRRHFPAINWTQSYSQHADPAAVCFDGDHPGWGEQRRRLRELLQREDELREVAEVVGMEGLQERDRLLMRTAERLRLEFLCQNSFTADAYSAPAATLQRLAAILVEHDRIGAALDSGLTYSEALAREVCDAPR